MVEKIIEYLFYNDPDKLFSIIEKQGGSLEDIKKLGIAKIMIRERFPELIKKEHEEAVDFCFWFTYFVEREIRDTIIEVEKGLGKNIEDIDKLVDDMTFANKIIFIDKNYNTDLRSTTYINFLREVKNIRNNMAHGELDKLKYGGYHLSDPRGQLKILASLVNASLKKDK